MNAHGSKSEWGCSTESSSKSLARMHGHLYLVMFFFAVDTIIRIMCVSDHIQVMYSVQRYNILPALFTNINVDTPCILDYVFDNV
jgi:hypothetical protein